MKSFSLILDFMQENKLYLSSCPYILSIFFSTSATILGFVGIWIYSFLGFFIAVAVGEGCFSLHES